MNKFTWPLNNSSFNFFDRLKICSFILNRNNYWTQSKYVKKIEEDFAKFAGSKYAVFVSSGSTANTLLAMHLKDKYYSKTKNTIIFTIVIRQHGQMKELLKYLLFGVLLRET